MKTIEIILPTFDRIYELKSALACLMAQTSPNWLAHVVVDTPDRTVADDIVKEFNDERIYVTHLKERYADWGHSPREYGKQNSKADYVLMTGDDCYYVPIFIAELNRVIEADDPDFIYWDMVHSHYQYHYFVCHPNLNQIDMGAFAFRTKFGQQVKLGTTYAADGVFVNDFKNQFPNAKFKKIDKVLFVHN